MAQDIIINGSTYLGAKKVEIPKSAGGTATFYDSSVADVGSADIRNGKKAIGADGEITGNMPEKTASDVSVSGKTITIPEGHYNATTKAVTSETVDLKAEYVLAGHSGFNNSLQKIEGSATVPTVSFNSSTKVLSIS